MKFIEGLRGTNEHTVLGDLVHAKVDSPGYEQRAGWELLRALPLFSDKLGLTGKADLVEVRRAPCESETIDPKSQIHDRKVVRAHPVEYKKGPKRRFDNDEVQLCAQALCLEEMFGLSIADGAIYHASSARRTSVIFDETLRAQTLAAIADLKSLISYAVLPAPVLKPQCEGCSLHPVCVPETAGHRPPALFTPRSYT